MNREAKVLTGTQVKEVLAKVVGGIYIGKGYNEMITDFFSDFAVTDDGLKINVDNNITVNLPIADDDNYINYAIAGETEDEEWDGSKYFDCNFVVDGYTISFNTTDKGNMLTIEQLKELVKTDFIKNMFRVESIDGYAVSVNMNNCAVYVDDDEVRLTTNDAEVVLDNHEYYSIIDAIYNDSVESGFVCYRLEFSNNMPDITIEIEYGHRLFM